MLVLVITKCGLHPHRRRQLCFNRATLSLFPDFPPLSPILPSGIGPFWLAWPWRPRSHIQRGVNSLIWCRKCCSLGFATELATTKALALHRKKSAMFGSGYGRAQASTNPFEDDDEPSGGMLGSQTNEKEGSGTPSGFGSSSIDRGGSGLGDPFEKRSINNKDAWLQGKDDVHDPFNSNGSPAPKKSSSILGSLSPFGKSQPLQQESPMLGNNQQNSSDADRTSFGEFNTAPAAGTTAASPPAVSLPGPTPNYYASPAAMGETPISTCVSCYNRMSKNRATTKLNLEPNTGSANANVNALTNCDVCQHNLKELRDQMLMGGGLPPQPVGGNSSTVVGAFPRPSEEMVAAQRGSMGDGRSSFGAGNFDNRGSIESRGSDDMSAGMIRMQNNPTVAGKGSIFGMFGNKASNGKTY